MSETVGIGIITCNRPEFFKKCRESIKKEWYDYIVVVNDGNTPVYNAQSPVIGTAGMEGVGKAKNKALTYLQEKNCDYIILIEDDMLFRKTYLNNILRPINQPVYITLCLVTMARLIKLVLVVGYRYHVK